MCGDAAATEKLRNVIGEVVAVVLEEVVGLVTIDGLEGVEIFEKDLIRKKGETEGNNLHWFAVVGFPRDGELDSLPCESSVDYFKKVVYIYIYIDTCSSLTYHSSTPGRQQRCWCDRRHL